MPPDPPQHTSWVFTFTSCTGEICSLMWRVLSCVRFSIYFFNAWHFSSSGKHHKNLVVDGSRPSLSNFTCKPARSGFDFVHSVFTQRWFLKLWTASWSSTSWPQWDAIVFQSPPRISTRWEEQHAIATCSCDFNAWRPKYQGSVEYFTPASRTNWPPSPPWLLVLPLRSHLQKEASKLRWLIEIHRRKVPVMEMQAPYHPGPVYHNLCLGFGRVFPVGCLIPRDQ